MTLLVGGWTAAKARFLDEYPGRLGAFVTPGEGNRLPSVPIVYAADNGCFGGLDAPKFLRLLARLAAHPHKPLWVTCPDVVADAGATWGRYLTWAPVIRAIGLPVAFVLQDGVERMKYLYPLRGQWDNIAAVFVGGSTAWKLSPEAFGLTLEARAAGKLVHFGRVNTLDRIGHILRARKSGLCWCDTIDGGSSTRWGDTNIPKILRWIAESEADDQLILY